MTLDRLVLLRGATDDFATVLEGGDLTAPVPTCPGWTLADLGNHLREVHLWAAHAVVAGDPRGTSEPAHPDALAEAYRAAAARLVAVLEAAGPEGGAWTFGPDRTAGFWQRRQLHETTLHRYDALLSQGRAADWALDPALAWDGVDEVATLFYPRQVRLERTAPLPGRLVLTATDLGRSIELGEGDRVELAGTAADLLLMLWKRRPAGGPAAELLAATALTP